jgi:hypothetical protein
MQKGLVSPLKKFDEAQEDNIRWYFFHVIKRCIENSVQRSTERLNAKG